MIILQNNMLKVKSNLRKKYTCTFLLRCAGAMKKASSSRGQSDFFQWDSTFKGTNDRQKTYEISRVYSIFYSGFMCQTTVIFGIMKDGSLY